MTDISISFLQIYNEGITQCLQGRHLDLLLSRDRFHPRITWRNWISFPVKFHLLLLRKHALYYFFIPLEQAETIIYENFLPAKRALGSTKEGYCLTGIKLFTCNCRISIMKSVENCQDPGKTRQNFILANRDHAISA